MGMDGVSRLRRQPNNLGEHHPISLDLWDRAQALTNEDASEPFALHPAAEDQFGPRFLLADVVHNHAADGWNYGSLQSTAWIQESVSMTNEGSVASERAIAQGSARIATSVAQERGKPVKSEAQIPTAAAVTDLHEESYGATAAATLSASSSAGATPVADGSPADVMKTEVRSASIVDRPGLNWQDLKVGAGGWLTGIDIAPDGTMVVRTDTYGAYLWNGTEWQQLVTSASLSVLDGGVSNYSEGVYEIRIAPSDTNILYMEYLGSVYRSDNKGVTWKKTAFPHVVENPNDAYRMNGQKMAVDPNNPNVVYVGTPQDGLFLTTDGGARWQPVSSVPVSAKDSSGQYPGITGITFDPSSGGNSGRTNIVYASSGGHGVYKSTDGGLSWTALAGGPRDVENAAISSTGIYYAIGNNEQTLWRYMNGSWTELNPSGTAYSFQNPHTVAIDPFNPLHIVVGDEGGALNQSLDGGATWSGMNWNTQLSATDIPWLATAERYMSSGGMVFDPLVANKLIWLF